MAVITPTFIGTGTLTAAAVAYATAPANTNYIIKKCVFLNTDAVARTITIHRVPSGGTAVTGNIIMQAFSLSAGQTYDATFLGNMVLTPGATIQALASTAGVVNVFISGLST